MFPDGKPTLICCKTVIGMGSLNKAGTHDVHGAALGPPKWPPPRSSGLDGCARGARRICAPRGMCVSAAEPPRPPGASASEAYRASSTRSRPPEFERRMAGLLSADYRDRIAAPCSRPDRRRAPRGRRHPQGQPERAGPHRPAHARALRSGCADPTGSNPHHNFKGCVKAGRDTWATTCPTACVSSAWPPS